MLLKYAILTELSARNATGYDIAKEFIKNPIYSSMNSHQQVYRELLNLANNNYLAFQLEPQDGRPDRKVYFITDLGRELLIEWLQKPALDSTIRDILSRKLLASSMMLASSTLLESSKM